MIKEILKMAVAVIAAQVIIGYLPAAVKAPLRLA